MAIWGSCSINMPLLTELAQSLIPAKTALSRIRQVLPGCQSRRPPGAHRRGQPLQSEARNAKNAPESAICGVLPNRQTPTGSVSWLVLISSPRSGPRRVSRTNLPSGASLARRSSQLITICLRASYTRLFLEHEPEDSGQARALAILHQADDLTGQVTILLNLEIEHADGDKVRPVFERIREGLARIN